VVGIVEDGKYQGLAEETFPALFVPILQHPDRGVILIARTMRTEREVAAEMRSAVQDLDARLPVYSTASLNELLSFTYLPVRAAVISLGAFGLLAILLSITGIYGVRPTTCRGGRGRSLSASQSGRAGTKFCARSSGVH
jgi:hypothetical protein